MCPSSAIYSFFADPAGKHTDQTLIFDDRQTVHRKFGKFHGRVAQFLPWRGRHRLRGHDFTGGFGEAIPHDHIAVGDDPSR